VAEWVVDPSGKYWTSSTDAQRIGRHPQPAKSDGSCFNTGPQPEVFTTSAVGTAIPAPQFQNPEASRWLL